MYARVVLALALVSVVGVCGCQSPPPEHRPAAPLSPTAVSASADPHVVGGVRLPNPPHSDDAPGTIVGTVPGRAGRRAVAKIEVRDTRGRLVSQVVTDSHGSFQLDVPPGSYIVTSHSQGDLHAVRKTVSVGSSASVPLEFGRPVEPVRGQAPTGHY